MLQIEKKLLYRAFGMTIASEIKLPELTVISEFNDKADIEIKIQEPATYHDLSQHSMKFVFKDNLVKFYIAEAAEFTIEEGRQILVSPMKEADDDEIRLLILGTCMGVILMQRRIYPLHGSAIVIQGKAYAIIGESGAGKSTLASAFLDQGFSLLSDDVIAVSLSQDHSAPFVTPSYPQQKLWQDSMDNFGLLASDYRPVFGRQNKYLIPLSSNYYSDPLPLAGVFELVKTDHDEIEIERIEKLERLHMLFRHTYRNFLIPQLGLMDWHFQISANIVNKIQMFQLRRPSCKYSAPQLVSLILDALED